MARPQHTKANTCFAFVFSPIGNLLIHQVRQEVDSPPPTPTHSYEQWHLAIPAHPIHVVSEHNTQALLKTEWGIQGEPNAHGTFTYKQDGIEVTGHLFSIIYDGELTHNTNTILHWQYASPDDMLSLMAQGHIHPISLQAYQALMASI